MTELEFKAWPKTPRLFRNVVITEKIDGTNAAVLVSEDGARVAAQSRNRIITPDADNYGFANWVHKNALALADALGPGYHYGEWWGSGIQRGYGLPKGEKRFSLFNTARWTTDEGLDALETVDGLYPVPVLYEGVFSEKEVRDILWGLAALGSPATGLKFKNPEGICVFHTQSRQVYKVLLENDEISKTEASG